MDLKNFTVYSDSDVFGELEGQLLVVSQVLAKCCIHVTFNLLCCVFYMYMYVLYEQLFVVCELSINYPQHCFSKVPYM